MNEIQECCLCKRPGGIIAKMPTGQLMHGGPCESYGLPLEEGQDQAHIDQLRSKGLEVTVAFTGRGPIDRVLEPLK